MCEPNERWGVLAASAEGFAAPLWTLGGRSDLPGAKLLAPSYAYK